MKQLLMAVMVIMIGVPELSAQQKIQKDETLSMLLSWTVPGSGQVYAGRLWRGVGIAVVEGIAVGVVTGVGVQTKKVKFTDTNGHTQTTRVADHHLSNGEIGAVAAGAVVGFGIYIWQIFDARKCARQYNQSNGFAMGMGFLPNGAAGIQAQVHF